MKKSLLVGINKYKESPLQGCVNDVAMMSHNLMKKGFEVVTLLDDNATKQNILEEFERLLATSKDDNDILVFHYSGHGSQVPDLSGDEPDGLDECLLPVDFSWDNVIIDDSLDELIAKYAMNKHVEIILDACHSGSGTRNVLFHSNPTKITSRFIQPPRELFSYIDIAKVKVNNVHPKDVITWSGCRDDQTSADAIINGDYNGAFTYAFSKCLESNQSRRKTLNCARQYLSTNGYSQEPQLSCSSDEIACSPFSLEKSWFNSLMFWK